VRNDGDITDVSSCVGHTITFAKLSIPAFWKADLLYQTEMSGR